LGSCASDAELQKLAQRLVKPDGEAWEEDELVDILTGGGFEAETTAK
jgi:hypothetical protein